MKYSLLEDQLITFRGRNSEIRKGTLPDVINELINDNILSFEALQPHQQQPWYSFLVQLASMVLARANNHEVPDESSEWLQLLKNFVKTETSWYLVVDDVSKPAFMQSPVPEDSLEAANYKQDVETPDELDMLLTSKNHDLKAHRIKNPTPEYWLYALITLQTMEGFMGSGNYGIVRMNGGYGSRPLVGLSAELTWGKRFRRDLDLLLDVRNRYEESYDLNGYSLIWEEPWDGKKQSSIPIYKCDPYFIEICRRVRFTNSEDGAMSCWTTTSKGKRISAPDELNGNTGDPWIPVDKKELKALTVAESGFTYNLLQQILFGNQFNTPLALEFRKNEKEGAFLIARVLSRGQGKTDGLHQRIIPIPKTITGKIFSDPSIKNLLADRAQQRVNLAAKVQKSALYASVATLISGGKNGSPDYSEVAPWIQQYSLAIDSRFFELLWSTVDMNEASARRQWEEVLYEESMRVLTRAERSIPIPSIGRLKTVSRARAIYFSGLRNIFEYILNDYPKLQKEEEGSA